MIVFLGDSITQWWDPEYFNHYFGMYHPVNLGMAGYTSEDTLRYIETSKLSGLRPSRIVLQIGTNDADHGIATGQTAETIQKICSLLLELCPKKKLLLVGPLPRGEYPFDRYRIYNKEVNKLLHRMNRDRVMYVNISIMFLKEDDIISKNIMYDFLHLTKFGYHILSEVVSEFLFSSTSEPASPTPCPRLS